VRRVIPSSRNQAKWPSGSRENDRRQRRRGHVTVLSAPGRIRPAFTRVPAWSDNVSREQASFLAAAQLWTCRAAPETSMACTATQPLLARVLGHA
jgi:hypothetical protein